MCAKTKTACIVKGALQLNFLFDCAKRFLFLSFCDENYKGDKKNLAILVCCMWGQHYRLASYLTSEYASMQCYLLLLVAV